MKPIAHLSIFVALFIGTLTFFRCQKEDSTEKTSNEISYQAFKISAQEFSKLIENQDAASVGVVISIEKNDVFIRMAVNKQLGLQFTNLGEQPESYLINVNSKDENLNKDEFKKENLEFWKDNFEVAYFSLKELGFILKHSDFVFISGAEIDFGYSIQRKSIGKNFSLKIEGDLSHLKNSPENGGQIVIPTTIIGQPCPPDWWTL